MDKVLIGMSGGVDSSVAAYLLKQEGYEVIGATIKFINDSESMINDAKEVCKKLNIEHIVLDFKEDFKKYVIDDFINKYENASTPNPCIECNKYLKFKKLYEEAEKLGIKYIATGHYASIKDGKIYKIDSPKDQTYFLYGIDKQLLNHILFPLANYTNKEEIRSIARTLGLEVSDKKDSQDICFIEKDYTDFLKDKIKPIPGNFVLKDGTILGKHKGIIYYTIGQRKGLGISYKEPLYVINLNKKNNEVILGKEEDLYSEYTYIENTNFLVDEIPNKVYIKVRYASIPVTGRVVKDNNKYKVIFDNKIKSVTNGQSLVIYNEENQLLGGGIINN